MDVRKLVLAEKSLVKSGEWKHGEIPRNQWPSRKAKAKAYKFGPDYQWRIITFHSEGHECRVKILLNESKQIFRARFGVTINSETVLLCDYEFHASEPGWHCHARCEDISNLNPSVTRFGSSRIPAAKRPHRRDQFLFRESEVTVVTAFNCAVKFFRLDKLEGML